MEVELLDSSLCEGEQTAVSPDVKEAVERLARQETRVKNLFMRVPLKRILMMQRR